MASDLWPMHGLFHKASLNPYAHLCVLWHYKFLKDIYIKHGAVIILKLYLHACFLIFLVNERTYFSLEARICN